MSVTVTRRELLSAIPGAFWLQPLLRAQPPGSLSTIAMNHVTLAVTNAKRSLEFYQRLFGLPVVANQGPVPILRIGPGPQFLALSERANGKPGIDHVCLTIEEFAVDRVMALLKSHGVEAAQGPGGGLGGGPLRGRVRMRGESAGGAKEGTPEIYFGDPDGITIQLQAAQYCGGGGVQGEVCAAPAEGKTAPLATREMNHVTLAVSDPGRSRDFYQRVFGLPTVAMQGKIPIMRVGRGPSFIALSSAGANPPGIHHVCLTVENFDADRTMRTLDTLGVGKAEGPSAPPLTARIRMRGPEAGGAKDGTPELYLTDPDGITIQLQHVDYCGGAGSGGEACSATGVPPA